MGRRARPVDPAAGPVESFAHDLRLLRETAGDPTYRSLAKKAGYSATTLSEAAGGVRLPSLEVTLAFVVACGGDAETWRRRWHAIDEGLRQRKLLSTVVGPPQDDVMSAPDAISPQAADVLAAAEAKSPETPAARPAATVGGRWYRRKWMVVGALTLVAGLIVSGLAAGGAFAGASDDPRGCPKPAGNIAFTATAYGNGAHLRSGAGLDQPLVATVPPGCTIGFTGFCIGQKVPDQTAGIPDTRWFIVRPTAVVASAVVHGNPPSGLAPVRCPDDQPAPAGISLTAAGSPDATSSVALTAAGPHVQIAGFAAYYAADPSSPSVRRWHQIGLTGDGDGKFSVTFQRGQLAARIRPGEKVPVVAVACLGGDAPSGIAAFATLHIPTSHGPATLSAYPGNADSTALRAACQYPNAYQ